MTKRGISLQWRQVLFFKAGMFQAVSSFFRSLNFSPAPYDPVFAELKTKDPIQRLEILNRLRKDELPIRLKYLPLFLKALAQDNPDVENCCLESTRRTALLCTLKLGNQGEKALIALCNKARSSKLWAIKDGLEQVDNLIGIDTELLCELLTATTININHHNLWSNSKAMPLLTWLESTLGITTKPHLDLPRFYASCDRGDKLATEYVPDSLPLRERGRTDYHRTEESSVEEGCVMEYLRTSPIIDA